MNKKTIEKLDKINLLWVMKKISLGSLARGMVFLTKSTESIKESFTSCMSSTIDKVKAVTEGEKQVAKESKTQKS